MSTAIPSRRIIGEAARAADDARQLARILYSMELGQLCRRRAHPARAHIGWILVSRGYSLRAVSRALGWADHTSLSYHLKRANAALAAGRWPFGGANRP